MIWPLPRNTREGLHLFASPAAVLYLVHDITAPRCTPASFYQRSANRVSFYLLFNLRNLLYLIQEFDSMEHFKQELIAYLDYYNNHRIKAKLKGLPPVLHRQQALSVA